MNKDDLSGTTPSKRASVARLAGLLLCAALAGCAAGRPAAGGAPAKPSAVQSQSEASVSVSVRVLGDAEAGSMLGVDLAKHDLQAVWLRVVNGSPARLRLLHGAIDPDLYSADEAAFLMRHDAGRGGVDALAQRLRDASMRILLAPGTASEGVVFVPRVVGGRYVDVQLLAPGRLHRFGFAVPLPDGDFDFEDVDPSRIYAGRDLPDLDDAGLRAALENIACCTTDEAASDEGDPLNLVLVGAPLPALTRAGWSFTHRIDLKSIEREIGAAITGRAYPVAPVSPLYALGRKQDVAMQRARETLTRRNHMRLWLAPFRHRGREVWVGQVSRDIGVKMTPKSPTLTTHVIDPAIDEARAYLLQSLLTHGLGARYGFARGAAAATREAPRANLTDDPFFSDGLRLVVMLADHAVAPAQIEELGWEEPAGPIAEGQSAGARAPVRLVAPPGDPKP